jgi:hypothetical protein
MARGVAAMLGRRGGPAFRRWLVSQLDAHTDPRAARYWRLVSIIQGRDEVGSRPARPTTPGSWPPSTTTRSIAPVGTATSG